jgi:hypothetical protein
VARRLTPLLIAILALIVLLLVGCSTPARMEKMAVADFPATQVGEASLATLSITVYGDDVGGFASHYYPLPRADFERALLESISRGGLFAAAPKGTDSDYNVSVGLIHMIAPQWSGTVTLETSWAISKPGTREEIGRRMIKTETPASFSKQRQATEKAAQMNIAEGIDWLAGALSD